MIPDDQLLRHYAQDGDEAAFAELVRRYVDMVYSIARRLTYGDAHLAQEVSQSVFTDLARKAGPLSSRATLSGWLHTSVRYAAHKALRGERRRRTHEQEASTMQDTTTTPEARWEQLQPLLDEAVGGLRENDRDLVTLRFFQNKTHREIGDALGLGEEAARKRVDRALDKLRAHFARRGVAVAAGVLAATIGANSVQAAPAGLAERLTGTSLATAGAAAEGIFLKILLMSTKTKLLAASAIALIIVMASAGTWLFIRQTTAIAQPTTSPTPTKAESSTPLAQVEMPKLPPAVEQPLASAPVAKSTDQSPDKLEKHFLDLLDQALKSPPGSSRNATILLEILALSSRDPALALSKVGLIDDLKARNDTIGRIYGWWLMEDPQQGLAELALLPEGKQTQAYYLNAFQIWAGANPAYPPLAAATALTLSPGPDQEQALKGVAASWAQYNPQAVLTWASGLQPANPAAMYSAVVAASAKDPNLAAQYVDQLTDASAQSNAIQNISVNMTKTDPTATLAWLDQVATGETYNNSVAKLISTVLVKNPTLATTLMNQVTEPGISDAVSASVAGSNWARTFPRDAAAWLQTLPESPARDAAIQKLVPSTSGN